MKWSRVWIAPAILMLALGAVATAQDTPAQPAGGPPLPKPGPEHQILKQDEGTWDATVEMLAGPPGAPASTSKGVETNKLTGGGLWLVTDFKSEMMGQPFEGHGVTGWDPAKKKFVGTWVDSMTTTLTTMESTYDPAAKRITGWMEAPDETGKPTRTKLVTEYKDADTRVFTMYMVNDGKETPSMRITYKRRK
jgi:hypothetical protein